MKADEETRGSCSYGTVVGETRTVVVDGILQVYRIAGEGPVCLVHSGGPGVDPAYMRLPELEHSLTLVYLDPVGSGGSDLLPDGDYSVSRYGHFAKAVLDDIGAPTCYFLGHSHGGFVGLQFAIEHPDRLAGLILYDTVPVNGRELRETATKEMAAFGQRWPDRPEAAAAVRIWEGVNAAQTIKVADDDSYQRYLNGILPAYFADYRKTVEQIGTFTLQVTRDPNRQPVTWNVRDRLSSIRTPSLVIVGTYDFICAPRFAYEMCAAMPHSQLHELHESGHFGHLEQADEFAASVSDFIRSLERELRDDRHGADRLG